MGAEPRPQIFEPGDHVVFSASWLQCCNGCCDIPTVFTVRACECQLCGLGNHVCTTERSSITGGWRHLAKRNIRHQGAMHVDDTAVLQLQPRRRGRRR